MKEATKPRVNQSPPRISALNPQGDKDFPRPIPAYKKLYIPYEAEPEDFTFEELELLSLLTPGEYWVTLNDGSRMTLTIRVIKNENTGAPERLFMESPQMFSNENKQRLTPLKTMLREILGEKAHGVLTMEQRRQKTQDGELEVSKGA